MRNKRLQTVISVKDLPNYKKNQVDKYNSANILQIFGVPEKICHKITRDQVSPLNLEQYRNLIDETVYLVGGDPLNRSIFACLILASYLTIVEKLTFPDDKDSVFRILDPDLRPHPFVVQSGRYKYLSLGEFVRLARERGDYDTLLSLCEKRLLILEDFNVLVKILSHPSYNFLCHLIAMRCSSGLPTIFISDTFSFPDEALESLMFRYVDLVLTLKVEANG